MEFCYIFHFCANQICWNSIYSSFLIDFKYNDSDYMGTYSLVGFFSSFFSHSFDNLMWAASPTRYKNNKQKCSFCVKIVDVLFLTIHRHSVLGIFIIR